MSAKAINTYNFSIILSITLLFLILNSCVKEPNSPINKTENLTQNSLVILTEGLWGLDNSNLDIINLDNYTYQKSYYQNINNVKLGDTANDILIKGDTLFVIVSTSKYIELIDLKTFKTIKRFFFEGNNYPRKMTYSNKFNNIYITDLYSDVIHILNLEKDTLMKNFIKTGASPEYIVHNNNYLYVANSGFGDYKQKEEGAGYIYIYDLNSLSLVNQVFVGPNLIELVLDSDNQNLFCSYINLPSKKDSLGGIVQFKILGLNLDKVNEIRTKASKLEYYENKLFYFTENGLEYFPTSNNETNYFLPKLIIRKKNKSENYYALKILKYKDNPTKLILGNAFNHSIDGELYFYNLDNILNNNNLNIEPINKFSTGINPSKILYY